MKRAVELIWPPHSPPGFTEYSEDDWLSIATHVLNSFESYLGSPVEYDRPLESHVDDGFRVRIWSPNAMLGPLTIAWRGVLACDVLGAGNDVNISISLFLYGNGKKIKTRGRESFLDFTFVKAGTDTGRWQLDGWQVDEHGEYECYDDDFLPPPRK